MPSSLLNDRFWIPLGASMLAASVTSAGIFAIRRFEAWGKRNTIYFISFAAGVLISASFLISCPSRSQWQREPLHIFLQGFSAFTCSTAS